MQPNIWIVITITCVGIALIVGTTIRSRTILSQERDPLVVAGCDRRSRIDIRASITLDRPLPTTVDREAVFEWAKRESTIGAMSLRWRPLTWLGIALLPTVLWLIAPITPLVLLLQCLTIVCGVYTIAVAWRTVSRCRELVSHPQTKPR